MWNITNIHYKKRICIILMLKILFVYVKSHNIKTTVF